jgi:hypothetical protein
MLSPVLNLKAYVSDEHIHQKAKTAKDLGGRAAAAGGTQ